MACRNYLQVRPSIRLPPIFLAPSLTSWPSTPGLHSRFSTSSPSLFRKRRHGNRERGVSALRRTGLRYPVGMSKYPLPEPVLDPKKRTEITTDPNHGLWSFFNKQKTLLTEPLEEAKHGRAWNRRELRNKAWEDIHALWWLCCRERNRLATDVAERRRLKIGTGDAETKGRDREVRKTMKVIKQVLTERWYTWEDARKLAEKEPTVDLYGDLQSPAYKPEGGYFQSDSDQNTKDTVPKS